MRKRNSKKLQKVMAVLLSAVLLAGMVQGAVPSDVQAAEAATQAVLPVSGTGWTLAADGKLTIDSNEGMTDWIANRDTYTEQIITVELRNGVTSIGEKAFNGCSRLTEITIPESVTSIGEKAFYGCSRLTEITIPESVTSIGESAFHNCSSLTEIMIPDNVTNIGALAFCGCNNLTDITIPDSVISIGEYAFWFCRSLTEITIPKSMTHIEKDTFDTCSRLRKITIPDSVTSIGGSAFYGCSSLTEITIPESVTSIGESAFRGCSSLTNIVLPSGMTRIEDDLFFECEGLSDITIPESVTSIGESAFRGCTSLTEVTIPSGVTSIEDDTFYECSSLMKITIPSGVTNIGNTVFVGCSKLGNIEIPSGVTSIGYGAFMECSSLKKIRIPSGVTSIEESAFGSCSGLTEISIPSGVTNIGIGAFAGCSSLENIEIPSGVTSIGETAFAMCSSLENIEIPSGVTSIGDYMFYECSSLTNIRIPSGVTSIGGYAFQECSSLTNIRIPSGVTSIGESAFYECSSLEKVMIPRTTPPTLGDTVFSGCKFETENSEGIMVPLESVDTYKAAWTEWAEYITAMPIDSTPPMGTIKIETNSWNSLLDAITFGLFYKETKLVTIEAEDADSGVDQIYYYISDRELSESELKVLGEDVWTAGKSFSINPDRKCVVYAKITDEAGNSAYLSSNGLVFDGTAPVISGVAEGETYRTSQTVTVTDANLKNVKVNDKEVVLIDHKFTLESATGVQTIVATDQAGNMAAVTVTVKTETENVKDAKNVVEDVLAGCVPTNDIVKNDIQSLMDKALSNAGITGVSVTVSDFTKTEATEDNEGSIRGTITITSGNETDSVEIAKTIGKLPSSNTEKVAAAKTAVQTALEDITVSNATTREEMQNTVEGALVQAGITGVSVTVSDFTKTEATEDSEGSIRGTITIASGNETDSVEFAKTIGKLPSSNTEKVAAAKTAVQTAIENITVSNATTREEMQNTVEGALVQAGITGVSVTVSDFSKTEATEDSEGSIRGTITITSGNETDSVEFAKTIGKLPSSNTEKVAAAKTAVQTAIENITVSNATTREEMQNAVEGALVQAGITGVSVTVSDFSKTEATEGNEGSIRGTITITSGNETDSVEFAKTIGKLPSTIKTPGNTGNTGNTGNITEEQKAFTQKIMKEKGVSEETAIKILALAEELDLSEETLLIGESTFANHQSEDDMNGSTFSILQAAASKVTAKSVKLTWKKVKGADGYQIYASPCGKKSKLKLVKTIKKSNVKTYTQKKRKKGTAYRYVVRAYKIIDGKKITIAVSKTIHVFTSGGKYGNAKAVKVKKTKLSLKKGKTFKIRASEVKKDKALKKHRAICYESSNTKVATVTKKGKIKAKTKGKCTVYVYAQNGKMKKVKVTVK